VSTIGFVKRGYFNIAYVTRNGYMTRPTGAVNYSALTLLLLLLKFHFEVSRLNAEKLTVIATIAPNTKKHIRSTLGIISITFIYRYKKLF